MTSYLDLEAYLQGVFLHPGGIDTTRVLLQRLCLPPGGRVLELGCGAGGTTALVAASHTGRLIAVDRLPAMLHAAQHRLYQHGLSTQVQLIQADIGQPLPFADAMFDAVYAESVLALLPVESVIPECSRILRPGGRLVMTERIWKSGVSAAEADRVNARSRRLFGIPAATPAPLDVQGWLDLIRAAGLVDAEAVPVDTLLQSRETGWYLRRRWGRALRYLAHPRQGLRSLLFKLERRRDETLWLTLESFMFTATKSNNG